MRLRKSWQNPGGGLPAHFLITEVELSADDFLKKTITRVVKYKKMVDTFLKIFINV